jgi:hypothetical protein
MLILHVGSGSIEGHHNLLQNFIMPGCSPKNIDKFANALSTEEDYYTKMVQDPTLWAEKKKEHAAAIEKHLKKKRITLKNIKGSRTIAHHRPTISHGLTYLKRIDAKMWPKSTESGMQGVAMPKVLCPISCSVFCNLSHEGQTRWVLVLKKSGVGSCHLASCSFRSVESAHGCYECW